MCINDDTSDIKQSISSIDCENPAHILIGDADANASPITNELHYGHDEIIDRNEEAEEIEVEI